MQDFLKSSLYQITAQMFRFPSKYNQTIIFRDFNDFLDGKFGKVTFRLTFSLRTPDGRKKTGCS